MKLIVTSVRNEAPWILEWIAFHKAIGFDYFLIYTNDNSDRSWELFDRLSSLKYVEVYNNLLEPGESPQRKAFSRGMTRIKEICPEWVACLDPDEYINLKSVDNVDQLIKNLSNPDAIAINWRFYGSSGLLEKGLGLTTERFLKCSSEDFKLNRVFKTVFKFSNSIKGFGPHTPWFKIDRLSDIRFCFADGTLVKEKYLVPCSPLNDPEAHRNFDVAQINHYAIRTRSEYIAKQARGNGMISNDSNKDHFSDKYFEIRDRNEKYDDSILRYIVPHKVEYLNLISILGIAELMLDIENDFLNYQLDNPSEFENGSIR